MSFLDKVVIVIGASGGIGSSVAAHFAEEGANVVVSGRNEKKLNDASEMCAKYGKPAFVVSADLTKDDEVTSIVDKTIQKFGKFDVLVFAAGILKRGSALDGTLLAGYDAVMKVNLRAAVKVTSVAAPHLIKTKGNIIYISSIYSTVTPSLPEFIPTSVSKAGLDHFMRCVALELAPQGVRVNSVNPGPVATDILDKNGIAECISWDEFEKSTPMKRISETQEVADMVLFLASDKAKSITGSVYVIDNGMHLKH